MGQPEAELIRRAQHGERDAFVALYQKHYASVYNYAFYRVRDEAVASDVAADVFVRLVEKIGTFRQQGRPLLAWLYTVARNLIVDHYRRQGRFIDDERDDETALPAWGSAEPTPDPLDYAHWQLTGQELASALTQLTEEQQQVILLKFVEGFNNDEVGQRLGKSIGAVKSLQHRALAALRRVLEGEYGYIAEQV